MNYPSGGEAAFLAPVHLPRGAAISELTCYGRSSGANSLALQVFLTVYDQRLHLGSTAMTQDLVTHSKIRTPTGGYVNAASTSALFVTLPANPNITFTDLDAITVVVFVNHIPGNRTRPAFVGCQITYYEEEI